MSNSNIEKLMKERSELLDELGKSSNLLRGSWVERYSLCSRPQCKCHRGERHGPRHYLVVNEGGKQKQKYIQKAQIEAVRKGIGQYKKMMEIINRITNINVILIKERKYDQN